MQGLGLVGPPNKSSSKKNFLQTEELELPPPPPPPSSTNGTTTRSPPLMSPADIKLSSPGLQGDGPPRQPLHQLAPRRTGPSPPDNNASPLLPPSALPLSAELANTVSPQILQSDRRRLVVNASNVPPARPRVLEPWETVGGSSSSRAKVPSVRAKPPPGAKTLFEQVLFQIDHELFGGFFSYSEISRVGGLNRNVRAFSQWAGWRRKAVFRGLVLPAERPRFWRAASGADLLYERLRARVVLDEESGETRYQSPLKSNVRCNKLKRFSWLWVHESCGNHGGRVREVGGGGEEEEERVGIFA